MVYDIYHFDMIAPGDSKDCYRTEILAMYHAPVSGSKILGHLSLDIFKDDGYTGITWVYVEHEFRGGGIATDLLNKAWKITLERGIDILGLVVDKSSEQEYLVKYYTKRGFEVEDEPTEKGGLIMYKRK